MYDKYLIEKGEDINSIAKKFLTKESVLMEINNIPFPDYFREGKEIIVPINKEKYFEYYTIKKGDSLYKIARENNVNPELLALLNGLDPDDYIYPNQEIMLPKNNYSYYVTAEGDTIDLILKKFNVDKSTISKILHDASWKEYSNNYELIPNIINDLHKTKTYNRKCKICGTNFDTTNEEQEYCSQDCSHISQRRSERPSKEELFELIKTTPFLQIGKMYGVSDNAIRKWCKAYNLPYKKKDVKNITETN
jgi:LysM repeat protein